MATYTVKNIFEVSSKIILSVKKLLIGGVDDS